jgi:hypothetical protein
MNLITNRISTGKPKRFEDFVKSCTEPKQVKTASTKVAEQEEADSSGQLDVEPLHQEGESTTMPKAGPSAKKDSGDASNGSSTGKVAEDKDEADSSGQPEAEAKLNNDPKAPEKEEKAGSADEITKEAGEKGMCSCGKPNFICKGKCSGDSDDSDDCDDKEEKEAKVEDEDEKEEKEASDKVEFVKVANLDDKNKSFLKEYWRQLFGDDYVSAMIAEK